MRSPLSRIVQSSFLRRFEFPRMRKILFEIQDHGHVRSAPPVYRLIRIADHHDGAAISNQIAQQPVLYPVHVLVLVDEHPSYPFPLPFPDLRVRREEMQRQNEQVVEIKRVVFAQQLLISLENGAGDRIDQTGRRKQIDGIHLVLDLGDFLDQR